MSYREIVASIIALLITSIALASAFAYYPLTITATPQAPRVVFQTGSNANQPDLGGKTIAVSIGANGTSASVTINPTYRETYYRNVLKLYNGDSRDMSVWIVFTYLSNTLPQGSIVRLFFYDVATNMKVKELDITSPTLNSPISIGSIAAGKTWQIDIYVNITEGISIVGASYSANAKLVYTPSSETPPANPSGGR